MKKHLFQKQHMKRSSRKVKKRPLLRLRRHTQTYARLVVSSPSDSVIQHSNEDKQSGTESYYECDTDNSNHEHDDDDKLPALSMDSDDDDDYDDNNKNDDDDDDDDDDDYYDDDDDDNNKNDDDDDDDYDDNKKYIILNYKDKVKVHDEIENDDDSSDMDTSSNYTISGLKGEYNDDEERGHDDIDDNDNRDGNDDRDDEKEKYSTNKNKDEYLQSLFMLQYRAYYVSKYGENKAYELKRIASLLEWTHYQVCSKKLIIRDMCKWTFIFFTQQIYLLNVYINRMMKIAKSMSESTIKLFLVTSLSPFWNWYTSIRDHCQTVFPINMNHYMHYQNIVKDIRSDCNKVIKRTRLTKKNKAWLIENHQIPEGDSVRTILKVIEKKYNHFKDIQENDIDNSIYNQFTKLLYASFYASPMGRVKVFENLRVRDIDVLLDKNRYYETTNFKTTSSIGIQPVRFSSMTR